MNRKRLYMLGTICITCILIILSEWFYVLWVQNNTLISADAKSTELSLDEMPAIELLRQPEESYVDLVNRPLFIKGRKPVNEPLPESMLPSQAVTNTFDWQLNGVFTTPKGLSALFSRSAKTGKNAYRKIMIDADLDGWKLTEIHMDRVLLELNNQSKEVVLLKPKSKVLSKSVTTPLAKGTPPEIPQPVQAPNPFNTPDSPPADVDDSENIDNDNP